MTILKKDYNFLYHLIVGVFVLVVSYFLNLNYFEWLWILLAIFIVLITEVINTAIEYVVDLYTLEHHILAKNAKDTAAFAVLLASFFAIIVSCIILLPKIINII